MTGAFLVIQVFGLFGPSDFQVERRADNEFLLRIPGRIERRYRGTLALREGRAFVTMDLETAVASAVAAESLPGASLEGLKAQAIVTRSYFTAAGGRHREFDFCDTTHCQFLREPPDPASAFARAARETQGMVLTYQDKVIEAMYSARCGGRTRTLEEIGMKVRDYPYFAVPCDECRRRPKGWTSKLDVDDAGSLLQGPSEAQRLKLGRRLGWSAIPGNNYKVIHTDNEVILKGDGAGHGVGLCQTGAAAGTSLRAILAHYFPGTAISLRR